ncbi:MAG: inorganic phosphate transporter [Desulfurococcaceae archaeon]
MDALLYLLIGWILAVLVAWIDGANNAGNSVGVLIGARGLSPKKALVVAALLDFLGAVLAGEHVSKTVARGIVNPSAVSSPRLVALGFILVLASTAAWMLAATLARVPISVSQATIGGLVGFGLVAGGLGAVNWAVASGVIASWLLTPLASMAVTLLLYKAYSRLRDEYGALGAAAFTVLGSFLACFVTLFLALEKVLGAWMGSLASLSAALLVAVLGFFLVTASSLRVEERQCTRSFLLVVSASMAFVHGANDIASSAGPLAALYSALLGEPLESSELELPPVLLLTTSAALSAGIVMWGVRVAETIGAGITPLTPETGFVSMLGASVTMGLIVRLGVPSSTTLAVVGAVAGVGLARGVEYLNSRSLARISSMWIIGFPATLSLSALLTWLAKSLAA